MLSGVTTALVLVSASAWADEATPMQLPVQEQALTTIVSTFNTDPNNAYAHNGISAWTISAAGSELGFRSDMAVPFTPSKDYTLKTITVAVTYFSGTNGVTISLNADAAGLPGAVLRKGSVTNLPAAGTCCTTVSIGAKGVQVKAGTPYWVVVKTDAKTADTWDGWNYNNINASGPFAYNDGRGWALKRKGIWPAFSVTGN